MSVCNLAFKFNSFFNMCKDSLMHQTCPTFLASVKIGYKVLSLMFIEKLEVIALIISHKMWERGAQFFQVLCLY